MSKGTKNILLSTIPMIKRTIEASNSIVLALIEADKMDRKAGNYNKSHISHVFRIQNLLSNIEAEIEEIEGASND